MAYLRRAVSLRRLLRVVDDGAGAAIGHAVKGGRAALGAETDGPARGILPAPPRPALGVGVGPAIGLPRRLARRVPGAVVGAALLQAGLAGDASGRRGFVAAGCAYPFGAARLGDAAGALALVFAGPLRIAPGLALGPEPGGAGTVVGAALLEAGFAERAGAGAVSPHFTHSPAARRSSVRWWKRSRLRRRFLAMSRQAMTTSFPRIRKWTMDALPAPGRQDVLEASRQPF